MLLKLAVHSLRVESVVTSQTDFDWRQCDVSRSSDQTIPTRTPSPSEACQRNECDVSIGTSALRDLTPGS